MGPRFIIIVPRQVQIKPPKIGKLLTLIFRSFYYLKCIKFDSNALNCYYYLYLGKKVGVE